MTSQYVRGSEWRRWELHLHTPFTKKEDNYIGESPEDKWNNFYQSISDYIGDGSDSLKNICAIAITDYLSIDNYLKVKKDDRLPPSVKFLFPNVEFRITPIARNSPINIHCMFSPEIAEELEERFLAKLEVLYHGIKYSAAKSQLISLGRAVSGEAQLSDEEAYKKGLNQYVLSPEAIPNVLMNDPELRENTIVVVSNKSTDGVSGIRCHSDYLTGNVSQLDATRRSIYQSADMIFSANPSDIDYFLGKKADSEESVKEKCGSLMPCVHGCDAHTNERVFEPDNQRYCWIKSDPTFEGLKQVLYEPEERVRISSSLPETKNSYHVIDYVKIVGNSDFDSKPVYFNENLSCIIGGKSTGKSLLLHNMALALDSAQVEEKVQIAATNVKKIPETEVYWRDGLCSDEQEDARKIVYIPQTYLNKLSDEHEEITEIDRIIQDIVLQDKQAADLFKKMEENIVVQKQRIAKVTVDFLQTVSEIKSITRSKKEIGDANGIEAEISKLTLEMEELSIRYDVTEEEVKEYQEAMEKVSQFAYQLNMLREERKALESTTSVLEKKELLGKDIIMFSDQLSSAIVKTQGVADTFWLKEREKIMLELEGSRLEIVRLKEQYDEQIDRLKPKVEGNEQIQKISQLILKEKEKLGQLSKYDNELSKRNIEYSEIISVMAKAFAGFKNHYMTYVEKVNSVFSIAEEDLEFNIQCVFRSEQFKEKMLDIINRKTTGRFEAFDLNNVMEQDVLDSTKMRSFIEDIVANSTDTVQLKGKYNTESALREIFGDWYNINYVVKMDDDSIKDMSPGKKALVLLRLLISLAESKCPILIDQPEDDLDNRSIFDELIKFLKTKKVDRQIIVATHNANIVLGGDAELVLVANQGGKNSPNKEFRFEYRGGSIENNTLVRDGDGKVTDGILNNKGIQTHICEILEGGEVAFDLRRSKYRFIRA